MYTLRIMQPVGPSRHISVRLETYADLSVALRVAGVRSRAPMTLVLVVRDGGEILARYGLEAQKSEG
jgi:hypothetical protein